MGKTGRGQRRGAAGPLAVTSAPGERQWCTRPPTRKRRSRPRAGVRPAEERVSGQCQRLATHRTKPALTSVSLRLGFKAIRRPVPSTLHSRPAHPSRPALPALPVPPSPPMAYRPPIPRTKAHPARPAQPATAIHRLSLLAESRRHGKRQPPPHSLQQAKRREPSNTDPATRTHQQTPSSSARANRPHCPTRRLPVQPSLSPGQRPPRQSGGLHDGLAGRGGRDAAVGRKGQTPGSPAPDRAALGGHTPREKTGGPPWWPSRSQQGGRAAFVTVTGGGPGRGLLPDTGHDDPVNLLHCCWPCVHRDPRQRLCSQ